MQRLPSARTGSAGRRALSAAVLLWLVAGLPEAASAQLAVGQSDYELNCATCHGLTGLGDGPQTPFIGLPPPANLSTCSYRLDPDMDGVVGTDADLFLVIRDSPVAFDPFANSFMFAFGPFLSASQIDDVISYIHTLEPIPCPEPGRTALALAALGPVAALRARAKALGAIR